MSTLIAYRVPPQCEFKAVKELERANIASRLPHETITRQTQGRKPTIRAVPLARGYIFAERKPHDAKHVKTAVGPVSQVEIIRLERTADRQQRRNDDIPFAIGQAVFYGEVPAKVVAIVRRVCRIKFHMLGKDHERSIHYTQLRPG